MYPYRLKRFQPYFVTLLIILLSACGDAANQAQSKIAPDNTKATLKSLELSPSNAGLAINTQIKLYAIGIYSDNTKRDVSDEVVWTSSAPNKAGFVTSGVGVKSFGVVAAKDTGVYTISASLDKISSKSIDIIVSNAALDSIVIESTESSTIEGTTSNLKAIGHFSDGSQQILTDFVTWSSSDTAIVTFNEKFPGTVSSLKTGSADASASLGGILSTPLKLTVNSSSTLSSIEIASQNNTIGLRTHTKYVAVAIYVDSSTQDITEDVFWTSSNNNVASISELPGDKGTASAVAAGETTIKAVFNGFTSNSINLVVTAADLMEIQISTTSPQPEPIDLALGSSIQFQASGKYRDQTIQDLTNEVIWVSKDSTVASIDNAHGDSGLVNSVFTGQTEITALYHGILSKLVRLKVTDLQLIKISITPASIQLATGVTQQYTATGTYTDGSTRDISKTVHWESTKPNLSTISNTSTSAGLATAVSLGTTLIKAHLSNLTSNIATLTTTDAQLTQLDISPLNPAINLGQKQQFTAIGTYSDQSTIDVTNLVLWKSDAPLIVSVSNAASSVGLSTSLDIGSATISASFQGLSAKALINVDPAALISINLTPTSATLKVGQTQQFEASAIYTDGPVNITTRATWSSIDVNVASVLGGLVTATNVGKTDITVNYNGMTNSATLSVTQLAPTITLSSATGATSVDVGSTLLLQATGGTTPYLWSINNTNASVNTKTGWITGTTAGPATVTATDANGLSGDLSITITTPPVTLVSIDISPINSQITSGGSQSFSASGNYSNSTKADISTSATWTSSNTSILVFDPITNGLAKSSVGSTGAVIIKATLNGVTSQTQLTILGPTISVSTTATLIQAQGPTVQMSATGGSGSYTWSVNDTTLATIDALGTLTPLTIGTVAVTAKDSDGFSGTTNKNISGALLANLFLSNGALQTCVDNYANSDPLNILITADQITTLDWYCNGYSNTTKISSLAGIESLTNLLVLDLNGNSITDLTPLSGLSNLTSLSLSQNNISDLVPLSDLLKLTSLTLNQNNISVFNGLETLSNLTSLDIGYNVFTPTTDLTSLGSLSKLTTLVIENQKFNYPGLTSDPNNNTLAPLSNLINLQKLYLYSQQITSLSFLTGLTNLERLYLDDNTNKTTKTAISDLTELNKVPRLTHLSLSYNNILDVSPISSLLNLQWLNLSGNASLNQTNFTNTFSLVDSFNLLTYLNINSTGISNISALRNLTSIARFSASYNGITDITPLALLTTLTEFTLSSNTPNTTMSDTTTLGKLTNLIYLRLSYNSITDITPLGNLTKLESLNLTGNTISYSTTNNALEKMPLLYELNLSKTGLDNLNIVKNLNQLANLTLDNNPIVNVFPLSNMSLNTMQYISLYNTTIGGAGIGNVDSLSTMNPLGSLFLDGAKNKGMSCGELSTLITTLNVGGASVVTPGIADPTTNCTNP